MNISEVGFMIQTFGLGWGWAAFFGGLSITFTLIGATIWTIGTVLTIVAVSYLEVNE